MALFIWAEEAFAMDWAKAMQLYYRDFNPMKEILIFFAMIVATGVLTYFYQKYKNKKLEEKRKMREGRGQKRGFDDYL
ncbi:MAG: hypothetical protein A2527_04440 [Candidatus Lambdaproteobacteria bacterium RIFOXYD2_FULL_50_16]|uniref:Uncharacterized protein n=1 Tax=Candidatus Lambdaproteobacteria bacterium RIFOXYD2_FULL_50_16 TaxID=1817772 RepID=A0A1F6GDN7_9PROT|nr:MAG: hypothetical protein A2527_04440 [Candidatus Lambdaproteobacteria bacterium RIFOXYD2_FULL_50_16]